MDVGERLLPTLRLVFIPLMLLAVPVSLVTHAPQWVLRVLVMLAVGLSGDALGLMLLHIILSKCSIILPRE